MNLDSRSSFLNMAGLVQGGLLLVTLFLAWLLNVPLYERLYWSWRDFGWGLAGTLPMLIVLAAAGHLRRLVADLIGQPLSLCKWYDLILLAALAGAGEELLFRGVLSSWIGAWDPWAGIIAANVVFGLVHSLTPGYALLAAAFGFYLSWLTEYPDPPNLLRPIVTHAVYDYIAFLWILHEYRSRTPDEAPHPLGP
ncbi:MAG: CPBP family intramembrane metalloprotease [Planctomycetaceae bacterium]|nr:CPBP family intramembrane metalloprotease [Planctomycetaceae bacterium]